MSTSPLLNRSETAFVVTAVDVESGELKVSPIARSARRRRPRSSPHHVLASGSLPPQFPWTDIEEGSELRHLLGRRVGRQHPARRCHRRLQPWPGRQAGACHHEFVSADVRRPSSFFEVTERVDELRFGNRVHQDVKTADRVNMLATTIDELAETRARRASGRACDQRRQGARHEAREDGRAHP